MPDRSLVVPGSIDTHVHLALFASKGIDPVMLLAAAFASGLGGVLDVGVRPSDLDARRSLASAIPHSPGALLLTSGLHPTSVDPESVAAEIALLESQLVQDAARDPSGADSAASGGRFSVRAVGEIGLDYYWSAEQRALQIETFERQLDLALRYSLPIIVHNRDSERDMPSILARIRPRGIMHCFSQGADYCRACLDVGMHVSFGGNVTFRRNDEIREAARLVPDDRLLVETDSPFLSPDPVRGRPNHPGHLGFTIATLAAIRSSTPEAIAFICARNAARLFGFAPPPAAAHDSATPAGVS